jgi:hypothetical protein
MPESPERGSGIARMLMGAEGQPASKDGAPSTGERREAGLFVLNERQATSLLYDPRADVTRILVAAPPGSVSTVRTRTVAADLLLDAQGFLVGVDVEPDAPTRAIVMIGSHEQVSRKVPARVGVTSNAAGDLSEVRIGEARASFRGNEKNPYLKT